MADVIPFRRRVTAPREACEHPRFYLDAHRREARCEQCRQPLDLFELLRETGEALTKIEEQLRETHAALRHANAALLGPSSASGARARREREAEQETHAYGEDVPF
jgi:hypothetical protein